MPMDDVMAVDQRLARLEATVAQGFFEQGRRMGGLEGRMGRLEGRVDGLAGRMDGLDSRMDGLAGRMDRLEDRMDRLADRMDRLEDRMSALERKFDVFTETIRGDIKTILEVVTAGTNEMRRNTEAIRNEHAADRRLIFSILNDHSARLRSLEHPPEP